MSGNNRRGLGIVLAAIAMQMCLGATYSWSVYVQPLRELTGLLQGPAQLPFTLFYFAFPITMIISGSLLPRLGPRRAAVIGGLLFGAGWMLAAAGGRHFGFTVVGIGLLAGIGVGFAYIVPVTTCIRWFPQHKGLVSGLAVAGFGGGAALISYLGERLITLHGFSPFQVFLVLGAAFMLITVSAGLTMQNPSQPALAISAAEHRPLPLAAFLTDGGFMLLYGLMFSGIAAGFMVNANLKELYLAAGTRAGVQAVALFAVANAAGRILWGVLFDQLPAALVLRVNLALQALVLLGAVFILKSTAGLWLFAVVTGFNYGGVLVLYVATVARRWGAHHTGQIYGWLFSANIPAAAAPLLAGLVFDRTGSFILPLACGGLLLAGGLVGFVIISHTRYRRAVSF